MLQCVRVYVILRDKNRHLGICLCSEESPLLTAKSVVQTESDYVLLCMNIVLQTPKAELLKNESR